MTDTLYLITVEGGIHPEVHGPYGSEQERTAAGRRLHAAQEPDTAATFFADVAPDGTLRIETAAAAFFDVDGVEHDETRPVLVRVDNPTVAKEPPIIRAGTSGPTRSAEQAGAILEVVGIDDTKRYRVTYHGLMQVANDGAPPAVRAHVGAVIKVQHSDTRFDLCVVEEDVTEDDEPVASLTLLRMAD